jgi:hypothetical protein
MSRASISTAMLVLALGAMSALSPRIALATPSKDGCTGMLEWDPQQGSIGVYGTGTWCLDHDLVVDVDDSVITLVSVHAPDVTIDCRGHLVEYTGTADESYGVVAQDAGERLTVRNCRFRGFVAAINASGDGYVIEDNVVDASRPSEFGLGSAINGNGVGTIRRNRIHDAVFRGIYAQGPSRVTDNLIDGVVDPGGFQAMGMMIDMADGAEVTGNTIRGLGPSQEDAQHVAIMLNSDFGGLRTRVQDNVLIHDGTGGPVGVDCIASALLVDNVITGFFAPTFNCSNLVDNDISP